MSKLALKLRVFQWAAEQESPFSIDDIMKALKGEYGNERQFTEKRIDQYIQSFLGSCMMDVSSVAVDDNGKLRLSYMLTDFGRGRVKHIPGYKS